MKDWEGDIKHYTFMLNDSKNQTKVLIKIMKYLDSVEYKKEMYVSKTLREAVKTNMNENQKDQERYIDNIKFIAERINKYANVQNDEVKG